MFGSVGGSHVALAAVDVETFLVLYLCTVAHLLSSGGRNERFPRSATNGPKSLSPCLADQLRQPIHPKTPFFCGVVA